MNGALTSAGPLSRLAGVPPAMLARRVLQVDAVVTGLNGLTYIAAAEALDDVLGVPAGFLRGIGAFLTVFGLVAWAVAAAGRPHRVAVLTIAVANGAWVLASLVLVAAGWHDPTTGGTVWTLLQAATVGGFAAAQAWAARRLV